MLTPAGGGVATDGSETPAAGLSRREVLSARRLKRQQTAHGDVPTPRDVDAAKRVCTYEGADGYWSVDQHLTAEARAVLLDVAPFFTADRLRQIIVPLVREDAPVSLRLLLWFVSNFAKEYRTRMPLAHERDQLVYSCYLQKRAPTKGQCFDPFRRFFVLYFELDGEIFKTTVSQLAFLRWCETHGILQHVLSHSAEIEQHRQRRTQEEEAKQAQLRKLGKPLKRRRLAPRGPRTPLLLAHQLSAVEQPRDLSRAHVTAAVVLRPPPPPPPPPPPLPPHPSPHQQSSPPPKRHKPMVMNVSKVDPIDNVVDPRSCAPATAPPPFGRIVFWNHPHHRQARLEPRPSGPSKNS